MVSKARAERYRKAEALIRRLVKKGYSTNQIQRELQKKGLGIRRKNMLKMVRKARGARKKPHAEKHVPIKYRRVKWRKQARRKPMFLAKWIAVYGTVNGKSRRVELAGSGRQLYRAMLDLAKHPPKKRFVRCSAIEAPRYLDYEDEWDKHPEVIS